MMPFWENTVARAEKLLSALDGKCFVCGHDLTQEKHFRLSLADSIRCENCGLRVEIGTKKNERRSIMLSLALGAVALLFYLLVKYL